MSRVQALITTLLLGALTPTSSWAQADEQGYFGFAVGLYPREAARRGLAYPPALDELLSAGAGSVLLPLPWVMEHGASTAIERGPDSIPDAVVLSLAAEARQRGLRVVFLPYLELRSGAPGQWRGNITPTNRPAWWRSYGAFVLHHAELASQAGASLLAVGSELTSMAGEGESQHWRELITAVRQRFSGKLAWVANHDALDRIAPIETVDFAGVSAYFPLAKDGEASEEAMVQAWAGAARRLEALAKRSGKPVVVFELGYPSMDGGSARPWDYTRGSPVDLEEQRRAYAATRRVLGGVPWLRGLFFWTWFGPGGRYDRYYTPRGKPALNEATAFLRRARSRATRSASPKGASRGDRAVPGDRVAASSEP